MQARSSRKDPPMPLTRRLTSARARTHRPTPHPSRTRSTPSPEPAVPVPHTSPASLYHPIDNALAKCTTQQLDNLLQDTHLTDQELAHILTSQDYQQHRQRRALILQNQM